jgi:hypothetical protein
MRNPIILALLIGGVAALITALLPHPISWQGVAIGDIAPPLAGMHAWLHGEDPYGFTIQGGEEIVTNPFTTMIALLPFLALPLPMVPPVFMGLSSALLAYGLLKDGEYWRLLLFLSTPYLFALYTVQWSPLFTTALLLPALLVVAPIKPQLGLVLLAAGRWNWRLLAITALFVLVSLALYPMWPLDFLQRGSLSTYDGRSPVLIIPGFLVLLALVRWRDWRARLLVALVLVPQRLWYDQLLLFAIPQSKQSMLALVTCSWLVVLLNVWTGWFDLVDFPIQSWVSVIIGLYVPALVIVLHPMLTQRQQPSP